MPPKSKLPKLYDRPNSSWWWVSWNGDRSSCQSLGLSLDVPHDEALLRVMQHFGLVKEKAEAGEETLGWFHAFLTMRGDPNVGERTLKLYLSDFKLFVEFLGPEFPLRDVRRIPHVVQFQEWLSRTKRTKRNPVTINITCRSVQAVFRRAFDLGYVEYNPFTRFPRLREHDDQQVHMEEPELERFLKAIRNWEIPAAAVRKRKPVFYEGLRRLPLIFIYLARRRSEVFDIRREDINITNMTIRLYLRKKRRRVEVLVDIPEDLRDTVQWFLDTFPQEEYPFRVCDGDTLNRYIKVWLKDARLPLNLHLHSLRHTAISLAANQPDANLRAIQQLTGHSTLAAIEKYVHGKSLGKMNFGKKYTIQREPKTAPCDNDCADEAP